MITWLDGYVRQCWNNWQKQGKALARQLGLPDFEDPVSLARFQVKATVEAGVQMSRQYAIRPEYGESQYAQALMVAPFILPELSGPSLAVHLTPELAEDFHGTKPPETDAWRDVLKRFDRLYIDLPQGVYKVADDYHVRAIFVQKPWADGTTQMLVCVPRDGRLDLDYQIELSVPMGQKVVDHKLISTNGDTGEQIPFNVTTRQLQDLAEDLVKMVLLYYATQEGQEETGELPRVDAEDFKRLRTEKKRNAKLKTHTLFKVKRLGSPKGRFGRTDQERVPEGGWSLNQRVSVKSHWRWQACGPRWSEHKLTWIAEHVRGKDHPDKPAMIVLDK